MLETYSDGRYLYNADIASSNAYLVLGAKGCI